MITGIIILVVLVAVIAIIAFYVIGQYNSLVKWSTRVEESWSQISVQLERRYDLIPSLVNTVKGYAKHEQETLDKVIQARSGLVSGSAQERLDADNHLQSTLKSIFSLKEAYPDLKADTQFLKLEEELVSTENKVAYSRQTFNRSVAKYNIKRRTFPTVIFASMLGFENKKQLEIEDEKREAPTVEF